MTGTGRGCVRLVVLVAVCVALWGLVLAVVVAAVDMLAIGW